MYSYDLHQDGMVVASVSAPTKEMAWKEISHYAAVYSQDGPVEIKLAEDSTPPIERDKR